MKIAVVGTGYVGLVTGVCLADSGNHVIGHEMDVGKVASLNNGECTIFEPGLSDLLQKNLAAKRFRATGNLDEAVRDADIVFIAVGTPPKKDGSADMSMIENAVLDIAKAVRKGIILVIKSTVPVGACAKIELLVKTASKHAIAVVSNPEFLKEGTAVEDFLRPDRIVIGTDDAQAAATMRELYAPFVRNQHPIIVVGRAAAEMIKYAANACLAMRISFINQVANLCEKLNIDVDEVRAGIGRDARIGPHFLYPGIGYGGSCFPKDVQALCHLAKQAGAEHDLLDTIHNVNERQKSRMVEKIRTFFSGDLKGRTFAMWGAAFKAKTDDTREAPAVRIIEGLLEAGAKVRVCDPKALDNLREQFGTKIEDCDDDYEATAKADALVICTEWNEFRSPDFERLRKSLKRPVIFDGRNLYTVQQMSRMGFIYHSIGRPTVK